MSVIQAGTGSTKKAAKETLDALLSTVTLSLKRNKKFQIVGFGTYTVVRRPARRGRNPRTGEAIRVKASKTVRFKAGTKLKGSI
jgi:DNA-binding protein HU-beta